MSTIGIVLGTLYIAAAVYLAVCAFVELHTRQLYYGGQDN